MNRYEVHITFKTGLTPWVQTGVPANTEEEAIAETIREMRSRKVNDEIKASKATLMFADSIELFDAEPGTELAPPEPPKELSEILVFEEQLPMDYFTNDHYDQALIRIGEETKSLIYPADEAGNKQARADATAINKLITTATKHAKDLYAILTGDAKKGLDRKMELIGVITDNRKQLIAQQEQRNQERLNKCRQLLNDYVIDLWKLHGVLPEFQKGDIEKMVALGSMTATGNMTKKAQDFCQQIVKDNLAWQKTIDARHLTIENQCLKAGINPPLTADHLGSAFYAEDAAFSHRLQTLIDAEIERVKQIEARAQKQAEEQAEREKQQALKMQQEQLEKEHANNLEQFKQDYQQKIDEQTEKAFPKAPELPEGRTTAQQVFDEQERQKQARFDKRFPDVEPPKAQPANGRRIVQMMAVFEFSVIERASDASVEKHFRGQLPEKLANDIKEIRFL
jgi:hypothetical protein